MTFKSTILSVFFTAIFSIGLSAQSFNQAKMDSLFDRVEQADKAMASFSLFKDGKNVYSRSIGYADVENKIKANENTHYRIGSITKTYTAVMIMQLVEKDQLALSDKLSSFYPTIPNANKITIEQLLHHRSGLYNFTNSDSYTSIMESPITEDAFITMFIKNGTNFEPGEKMEYSNTGYVMLSLVIQKITGKSYSENLNERIIKPLNLKNTFYGRKIDPKNGDAYSYNFNDSWEKSTETHMSVPTGAGAIVSNASDVNVFFYHLMNGKLISKESLQTMMTMKDRYGFALIQIPFYGKVAYGHNGGIDSFVSSTGYFPEENVGITLLTNGMNTNMNNILIGILSIYFDRTYELPVYQDQIKMSKADLSKYNGVYSAPNFPLKITISVSGNTLQAQATGQASFPIDAYGDHVFKAEQYGIRLKFNPEKKTMIFSQGGQTFELSKE